MMSSVAAGKQAVMKGTEPIVSGKTGDGILSRSDNIKLLYCGFASGLVQAAMFNPWDRGLYLSIKDDRPFLHMKNFESPFAGVFQSIIQRGLSAGLYFPLEEISAVYMMNVYGDRVSKAHLTIAAGTCAGALNGFIMNPLTTVKYHIWGKPEGSKATFFSTASEMLKQGGMRPFFVGSIATISRDIIFGAIFSFLRHNDTIFKECYFCESKLFLWVFPHYGTKITSNSVLHRTKKTDDSNQWEGKNAPRPRAGFVVDLLSATIATTISAPFNYIRNIHYATPPGERAQSFRQVMTELWNHSPKECSTLRKIQHSAHQMRLGWGTARVACGLAVASQFYSFCSTGTFR